MSKIIQGDCLEVMKDIPDKSIDMVLTSPPYDNLRTYNGSLDWGEHIWKPVIQELFRVIKNGGVVVWVVGDATIKGSETGTSFKQALYFKEIGFNLHDTMIYQKLNYPPLTHNRYEQCFEYMFILSKGKPKSFNPIKVETKHKGRIPSGTFYHKSSQNTPTKANNNKSVNELKIKQNIFDYVVGGKKDGHPAPFPEKLAEDHILSWSNEGDTILDPFAGSGTVGKMAQQLSREYILIEKEPEYIEIIKKRLNK
jgi:DNA modification methylase